MGTASEGVEDLEQDRGLLTGYLAPTFLFERIPVRMVDANVAPHEQAGRHADLRRQGPLGKVLCQAGASAVRVREVLPAQRDTERPRHGRAHIAGDTAPGRDLPWLKDDADVLEM